jgi:anti-sigma factor RsiW
MVEVTGVPDSADHFEWDERLQDWIDGDLDAAESAALEAHIAGCRPCQARLSAFRTVDEALSESLPGQTLPESFDRVVLERIDVASKAGRAAARARIQREYQDEIGAFSRQWRTALRSMILNVVVATALLAAFLTRLSGSFSAASLTDQIGQFALYAYSRPGLTLAVMAATMSLVAFGLTRVFGERP